MHLLSGLFNVIILMGALQGCIISVLLFYSKKTDNRLLASLIFLISLASLNTWLENQQWYHSGLFFQLFSAVVPMVIIMPLGPLLYFYTLSSLDSDFTLRKRDLIHFYSVVIDLLPWFIYIFYLIGLVTGLLKNNPTPVSSFVDNYNVYADIPRWLSMTAYLIYSIRYVAAYSKQNNVPQQSFQLKWLSQFMIAFLIFQSIWLIYLIPYIIPAFTDRVLLTFNWYPIYVPLSILIYWLGIKGYVIRQHQNITTPKTSAALLSPVIVNETISGLKKAMKEDQLYLNPELNLSLLSKHTGIAPKILSAVLNQHLRESFTDFVNSYRIAAFKEKYRQPENSHLTILGIALQCGFGSQATFQRSFKQFTGLSPSEFKDSTLQILK
jgi:AraC-like DNA-binding protein